MNLDPLGEHDDAILNDALRAAGLFTLQGTTGGEGMQITLDTMLASGGANLSVGQRQILALGRALIRGSKILVLDEGSISNLAFTSPHTERLHSHVSRRWVSFSPLQSLNQALMSTDYETDKVIQESLRTELPKDVTLLTVAHRLQSIMDADRIVRLLL